MNHPAEMMIHQYLENATSGKSAMSQENIEQVATDIKDALNRQYLSVNNDKKEGLDLINKYATGYQSLVILNTVNSDKYPDFCYYYTADMIQRKFRLGRDYEYP